MLELKTERLNFNEMTNLEISICGKSFLADMSGALYWPSQRALIVADLDLATATNSERGAPGILENETSETLSRLASVIDTYDALRVIALDGGIAPDNTDGTLASQGAHISEEDRKTLSIMQDHCSWIWVSDIPDDKKGVLPGGEIRRSYTAEGLTLCHQPTRGLATHEISGALRPAAKVSRLGHEIRRPCFVSDGLRIILPAFATFAGGHNILGPEFEPMFGSRGWDVLMLGHDGLFSIAPRLLQPD